MIDVLINSVVEILSQHIAVVLATQSCLTLGDSKDCQAPLSMEFSRQEHWNVPSPGYLPDPGIKPRPPTLQADSLLSEPPGKPLLNVHIFQITIYTLKMLQFYLSYLNKAEKINK